MFLSGSMWEDRGQPSASLLEEHSTIVIKLIKVCVCVCVVTVWGYCGEKTSKTTGDVYHANG